MVKRTSNFGIKALLRIYKIKLFLKGAIWPAIISLIILIIFISKVGVNNNLIDDVVGLVLNIIPSLLGFVLSGYALLIGFGNIEIIAKKKDLSSSPTLYQQLSTVFAVGLIMQILLLVFAFIIKLFLKASLTCFFENFRICNLINYFVFFLLIFGLLYVIIMIKDLVINIFNFSQAQHLIINKKDKNNTPKRKRIGYFSDFYSRRRSR
jgi:hypothetical protein